MKMIDRVLVLAAVHPNGTGTSEEIAEMLGITVNHVRVNASFLRKSRHLEKADGHGHLSPTEKGYKRALKLLGGKNAKWTNGMSEAEFTGLRAA